MSTEQLDLWIKVLAIAGLNLYVFVTCMDIIKRFNEISIVSKVRQAMQDRALGKVQKAYAQKEVRQHAAFEMPKFKINGWAILMAIIFAVIGFTIIYIYAIYDPSGGR